MIPSSTQSCRWADVVLAGVAVNLAALLLMPMLRPDLDLWQYSLSYYATGSWSTLQTAAFAAMGIASLALAVSLPAAELGSGWTPHCAGLLLISGLASFGLVLFPMGASGPATAIGDSHQTAGTIGGVAQVAAALAFALAAKTNPRWSRLFLPALVAFGISVSAALLSQLAIWRPDLGIPMGATMRLVVLPLVLLWGVVALRLRQTCPARFSRSPGAR